ncbi:MAG: hypothetical protein ACHQ4G_10610 [Opitutales bacterium]
MNWNDYEAVWKRQPLPLGAAAKVEDLKASFESSHRKLYGALAVRDCSESIAAVVGSVAFAFLWRRLGAAGWPIGIALVLILGVARFYLRERRRRRSRRLGANAPLLGQVEADLAELRHQRQLLHSIWKWYLGPLFAAILLVHFTLAYHAPSWAPQRDPVFNAGFVGFYSVCLGFVWLINRRAGRQRLEPRIAELEKLRADLLSQV